MKLSNVNPQLVPGFGFHLKGDGFWDVAEIPERVLNTAEFFGNIDIEGYPSVVFQTPSGDQWAQKSPGTPAPDTPTDEKLFMSSKIDFSAPFFKSSRVSSDVLDLLKDKQMTGQLPESYLEFYDNASDEEELTSVLQDLGEIAQKTFEKVFPGETFTFSTGGGSLDFIVHEAGHVILDPSFDLQGFGKSLQGTGTAVDHIYDELMNMIILTGDGGEQFYENGGINQLIFKIIGENTYGEIFDFIENNTTRPEYKKYSGMLVSNLRNKYRNVLNNIPSEEKREDVDLLTDIIDYIVNKFSKDPFIPGGEAREVAYKKWFLLFSKHVDKYFDEYESKESLKSVAARIAGIV